MRWGQGGWFDSVIAHTAFGLGWLSHLLEMGGRFPALVFSGE